jgi:nicotinamidase-related amidase
MPLLDPSGCVLVVIDVQPGFYAGSDLAAADRAGAQAALDCARWLTTLAARLGVPIVVTEEDASRNGPTASELLAALPAGTPVLDKATFGLAGSPEILAAVRATSRPVAVLVGYETDVCVAQSAVGLLEAGLRVVVVEDATFSPGPMHARGLARAVREGAVVDHTKGVGYEWVRTVEASRRILDADPSLNPAPFRL